MTETADIQARTTLITVSASYGAGGSVVAPELAKRLGVPFLSRATASPDELAASPECREIVSTHERRAVPAHRLLACLAHAIPAGPTMSPPGTHHHYEQLRGDADAEIERFAADGAGVILGRAAAAALGPDRGFHVRLHGPIERRIAQGARIERVDLDESREHLKAADGVRDAYVRRLYDVDPTDESLYHLVIDSTAVSLATTVELILAAAGGDASISEP